ncbi:MAG: hypothetical protein KKB82_00900 [Candidatus Omnitrophica bacterium]|nr:hypothetical protein [Candidatus Omnitrophota bacterium]MBU1924460.1 hypothetical protein [Candidatus Omnitrophota bacterium]
MIKYLTPVTICILIILTTTCGYSSSDVSTADLIKESAFWDGQIVVISGEAVGVPIKLERNVWLNIYDGKRAIGVFCSKNAVQSLNFGDYNYTGDVLEVTGKFNAHCPEHRGEMDMHAESIKITSCGWRRTHRPAAAKVKLAIICLVAAFVNGCVLFFKNTKR